MTKNERAMFIAKYIEGFTARDQVKFAEYSERYEKYYSSFDGLMPIIERINKDDSRDGIDITYEVIAYGNHCKYATFDYKDNDLITALQKAILFYYENKAKI